VVVVEDRIVSSRSLRYASLYFLALQLMLVESLLLLASFRAQSFLPALLTRAQGCLAFELAEHLSSLQAGLELSVLARKLGIA